MFLLIVTQNVEKNIFQNDYVTEQLFFKEDYRNHLVMNKEHFFRNYFKKLYQFADKHFA